MRRLSAVLVLVIAVVLLMHVQSVSAETIDYTFCPDGLPGLCAGTTYNYPSSGYVYNMVLTPPPDSSYTLTTAIVNYDMGESDPQGLGHIYLYYWDYSTNLYVKFASSCRLACTGGTGSTSIPLTAIFTDGIAKIKVEWGEPRGYGRGRGVVAELNLIESYSVPTPTPTPSPTPTPTPTASPSGGGGGGGGVVTPRPTVTPTVTPTPTVTVTPPVNATVIELPPEFQKLAGAVISPLEALIICGMGMIIYALFGKNSDDRLASVGLLFVLYPAWSMGWLTTTQALMAVLPP